MPRISIDKFENLICQQVPFIAALGAHLEKLGKGTATVRMSGKAEFLRPGDTVNGPVLVALVDVAMYAAIMSLIGRSEMALTTNLNINFLRPPPLGELVAEARMIKLGKRLAVMEATVFSEGYDEPVVHATGTYSIPPDKGK